MPYESGYNGTLISLGGVRGRQNKGREVVPVANTILDAGVIIASDNPARIALFIRNTGDNRIDIELGAATTIMIYLYPNETFQIDQNIPWTGSLYGFTAAGLTSYITGFEISVI